MTKQTALYVDRGSQRFEQVKSDLERSGFELHEARNKTAAEELLKKNIYRLIVLHFDTIGNCVFDLCELIRSGNQDVTVVVLMGKVDIETEVKLFEYNVDDVMVGKQTYGRVLIKRIQAHLNRPRLPVFDNRMRYGTA